MKKPKKDIPICPNCNAHPTIKKGLRKNKQRIIQKYQCKACNHYFTSQPQIQKSKTYDLKTILNAISNYNLGTPIRKIKPPKSTIHNWIKQLKRDLPFNRLRNKIKSQPTHSIIIKKQFIHHQQPFLFQYHSLKLDFTKKFPTLINYLKEINTSLPKQIFDNSERISQISRETPTTWMKSECRGKFGYEVPNFPLRVKHFLGEKMTVFESNVVVGVSSSKSKINTKQKTNLTQKQNYATKLADLALSITKDNKKRHTIIENFMLINDTATIATEIPVYLTENESPTNKSLTGHIDILQIRYHKIYILDFKPELVSKQQAIRQLKLYQLALSKRTNIPKYKFKLAFFNNREYREIN